MLTAPMHVLRSRLSQAGLLLTIALAGCGGAATQMSSQTPPTVNQPDQLNFILPIAQRLLHPSTHIGSGLPPAIPAINGPFVTTAQAYGSDANVYQTSTGHAATLRGNPAGGTKLKFLERITTGLDEPIGTAITPSGTWYLANVAGANVSVYSITKSGVTGPIETLNDPGEDPIDVDATASGSLVAVSNDTGSSGTGSISLYSGGSLDPTGTLSVPNVSGIGIALDKVGDCFWSYNNGSGSHGGAIVEFPKCKGKPITIVSSLVAAGGIAFDGAGDLFYVDQGAHLVYRCVKKASCSQLGTATFVDPFMINFDAKWKHLWLTDVGASPPSGGGTIYALDPKTGAVLSATPSHDPNDPPFGVAAAPGPAY